MVRIGRERIATRNNNRNLKWLDRRHVDGEGRLDKTVGSVARLVAPLAGRVLGEIDRGRDTEYDYPRFSFNS